MMHIYWTIFSRRADKMEETSTRNRAEIFLSLCERIGIGGIPARDDLKRMRVVAFALQQSVSFFREREPMDDYHTFKQFFCGFSSSEFSGETKLQGNDKNG